MGKPMGRPKLPNPMSKRLWVRLTVGDFNKLAAVLPGDTAGTVDPNRAREVLGLLADVSLKVRDGEYTPGMAADQMEVFFSGLVCPDNLKMQSSVVDDGS